MRRFLFTAAVVALAVTPAAALRVAMPNLTTAQKAVQADAVVVGKVTEIEKDEVEVLPYQGATDKVKMKVAAIKVEDGLIGAKNVTHVKVLMPGSAAEQPVIDLPGGPVARPAIGRIPPGRGGFGQVTLKDGDEGLYFLAKHPTAANYYVINPGNQPVAAKDENYKAELTKVKATVAVLADPMKALKAEKAEDRLSAAATLIQKYRRGLPVPAKEEAIPAEESKAIMKVIMDADWNAGQNPKPGQVIDYQAQPQNLIGMLGLYPGSPAGIPQIQVKPGENYQAKYQEAVKAWYAKSGDKYEIKRFVPKDK